jgi:hypothetical protein
MMDVDGLLAQLLVPREGGARFYRLQNADGKVWLMPARRMRLAMELYQPSGRNGKLLKRWFPVLHGLVPVRRALHAEVTERAWSEAMAQRLAEVFGKEPVEAAVFCGTPCVHQKFTLQLCRHGRILGYLKATASEEVAALFRGEQRVLDELCRRGMTDIPQCLFCGELGAGGVTLFVQSTVKTRGARTVHEWGPGQEEFLHRLTECTRRTLPFEESDFCATLRSLQEHLSWLPESVDRQRVAEVCGRLLAQGAGRTVEYAAYHADFTPWNMFLEHGRLFVFDWEYARLSYPPGLDRYHFFTQTGIFERRWDVEDFRRYLQSPEAGWVNREDYICYLMDIIARFTVREKGRVKGDVERCFNVWNGILEYCL